MLGHSRHTAQRIASHLPVSWSPAVSVRSSKVSEVSLLQASCAFPLRLALITLTQSNASPPHTSGSCAPPNPAALAYEAIKPPAVGLRNTHASVEA